MNHAAPDTPLLRKSSRLRTFIRTYAFERTLRRLPKSDRMLDLCCGYGFYFSINPAAKGIDGDPRCVDALQRRGYDVDLGNVLTTLPYDNGSFSHVLAHDAFEHFNELDLATILAEVHRVLEPDGLLIVWVPNQRGFLYGLTPEVGHKLFVTDEVIHRLAKGSFVVEHSHSEPLPRSVGRWFTHNKEVFHLRRQ